MLFRVVELSTLALYGSAAVSRQALEARLYPRASHFIPQATNASLHREYDSAVAKAKHELRNAVAVASSLQEGLQAPGGHRSWRSFAMLSVLPDELPPQHLMSLLGSTQTSSVDSQAEADNWGFDDAPMPLGEQGYQLVAEKVDPKQMAIFMRRVIKTHGYEIKDPKFFRKALRFFDGECARQSYQEILDELERGSSFQNCQVPWLRRKHSKSPVDNLSSLQVAAHVVAKAESGSAAFLEADNDKSVLNLNTTNNTMDRAMTAFVEGVVHEAGGKIVDYVNLRAFVPWYSGSLGTGTYQHLVEEILSQSKVPKGWVRGIREEAGGMHRYLNEGKLGFPDHIGKFAPMTPLGYEAVRLVGDQEEMRTYVHRSRKRADAMAHLVRGIVREMGGAIAKQEGFHEFATKCRITASDDEVNTIKEGIREAGRSREPWVRLPSSSKSAAKERHRPGAKEASRAAAKKAARLPSKKMPLPKPTTVARTAPLNSHGFKAVLKTGSNAEFFLFLRRVMAQHRMVLLHNRALEAFASYHNGQCGTSTFQQLVWDLHKAATATPRCGGGWITLSDNKKYDPVISEVRL